MTEQIRDGGPAFPTDDYNVEKGMSLRDWFAGMAMNGIVIAVGNQSEKLKFEAFAENAYMISDAMLKQREAK